MKDIYRLKKSEYNEGSEKALLNSEKHYEASLLLSKNELFPFAVTHLILAAEELVKAIVLKLRSLNNAVKIPDLDKYFKNHTLKHERLIKMVKALDNYHQNDKQPEQSNTAINEMDKIQNLFFISI